MRTATALWLAACTPDDGPQPDAGAQTDGAIGSEACTELGPAPLRRLTSFEYDNSVRDLFGVAGGADGFLPDVVVAGFDNGAAGQSISSAHARQYMLAAERVAAGARGYLASRLEQACGADVHPGCVATATAALARRVYRRPLSGPQSDRLTGLLDSLADTAPLDRITIALQVMLQSPLFLYRIEPGVPGPGPTLALTDHEIATRLSFLLWRSTPDEQLLAAADAGELHLPPQIRQQAERMLLSPRAERTIVDFHRQWLSYDRVLALAKTNAADPVQQARDAAAMVQQTRTRLGKRLLESDHGNLAALLGQGGDGEASAGLLTEASLLASWALPDGSSPVRRGQLVRERLLCQPVPPPPPNVMFSLPEPSPGLSTRERYRVLTQQPACAGCHRLMDPIGTLFEHYDELGAHRDLDNGASVDASGELTGTDVDGPLDGVLELARTLADSQTVVDCMITQWFRYGFGRLEVPEDACTLESIAQPFEASGYDIVELLIAITQTDAFRTRSAVASPEPSCR